MCVHVWGSHDPMFVLCNVQWQWHDLYLYRDVYLLCDVFENYRNISFSTYGLDPLGYLTAPALSWNCGLKYTGVKLELLTDVEKILFIDSALYGGYSAVVYPYSRANTPAMGDKYRELRVAQLEDNQLESNNLLVLTTPTDNNPHK